MTLWRRTLWASELPRSKNITCFLLCTCQVSPIYVTHQTYRSDCCQQANMSPIQTLPHATISHDGGEGLAVPHWPERGVGQGGQLSMAGAWVEWQHGVCLTDIQLIGAGCPGIPLLLGFTTHFAQNLTIHNFNCRNIHTVKMYYFLANSNLSYSNIKFCSTNIQSLHYQCHKSWSWHGV